MPSKKLLTDISESIDQATGFEKIDALAGEATSVLSWLTKAGELLPPWWSPRRDTALSRLWKQSDHLSSAVYNAQAKLAGIPFEIVPSDSSNMDHAKMAEEMTDSLLFMSEFGQGWLVAYERFIEDLLTRDNGAFLEILGYGDPDGPIVGRPIAVRHLDSSRCTRTGNPEFPVVYTGDEGKRYKMHWTRIISMSQMPSSDQDMNGVGFCAVSRASNIAQVMIDSIIYKQEKLGSRPLNQIVIGKGITGEQIMEAMWLGEESANNESRKRFAKTVAIGSENPDIGLDIIQLAHKDPFDEENTINMGMFAIAAAFGLDASELWPTSSGSTNKADSALRRLRSRGKLPAQTASSLEAQFNMKFMPTNEDGLPLLRMRFDFKDDEEDQQRALIRDIRSRNRERELNSGAMSVRVARQKMLDDGDVSRSEFNMMEVNDGRLPDGKEVGVLFFSSEPVFERHLSGSKELLKIRSNEREESLKSLENTKNDILEELAKTTSDKKTQQLMMASAAVNWLRDQYEVVGQNEFFDKIPAGMRRFTTDSIYQTRTDLRGDEEQQDDSGSDRAEGNTSGQDEQVSIQEDSNSSNQRRDKGIHENHEKLHSELEAQASLEDEK